MATSVKADAPRRRRWPRRVLIAIALLALLLFFAPAIVARTGLVQSAVQKALADFDGTATVGSASLGWFLPVELHDVSIRDSKGRTLLAAPRIVTSNSLLSLIRNRSDLGTVTVEQPSVEIVCENNTTNLETSLKKLLEKPADPAKPRPTLTVLVTNATVNVKDTEQKQEWILGDVTASAAVGADVRIKASIRKPETLELDATLGTGFAATFSAERFPIAVAGPFLRRFEPGLIIDGLLSGQVATETVGESLNVSGAIAVKNTVAASPRLGSERLALGTIDLPFKLESKGSVIRTSAKLSCSLGGASFSGSVDTAAPLEAVLQQPGISVNANVDLASLANMLPGLLKLQQGTQLQEGRLELHLTSAANGQWNGIASATALKGTRNGQVIRSGQAMVASFTGRVDAKYCPDFEKLEIATDFATLKAKGKLEDFQADAVVSLDSLAAQLGQFVDLAGITLAGSANLSAQGKPEAGATAITGRLRLNNLTAASKEWRVAGRGELAGKVRYDDKTLGVDLAASKLENVQFRGFGVDLDEPIVQVLPTEVNYDRALSKITIPRLQAATETFTIGAEKVSISKDGIGFTAATNANLGRLQKTLQLAGEPIAGIVRDGSVEFSAAGGVSRFKAKLPVTGFRYGAANSPIWSEPSLTLSVTGEYDPAGDSLKLESATLARPDGLAVEASGRVNELKTKQYLDVAGRMSYDLAALEPQLRDLLGSSVKARGKDSRPFHLRGTLDDPSLLVGDASVAWQSLTAYGFDIGASQLDAKLDRGTLTSNPLAATFSKTGTVKLQPSLTMKPGTYDLTFQKGRVIEKATLTPAACSEAIGFALPALAKSAQVEGTVSFDLEDHRVPLLDINGTALKGKLTLHNVTVMAGPVLSIVGELFGQSQAKMTLAKEQAVTIRIEKGRVFHDKLELTANGFTVTTSGSVGFDGTLNLVVQVPLPESALGPLLKNFPKVKDAAVNKRISIPITGTLTKPTLDRQAFQAAVQQFIKEVTRDAAKGKLEELLKGAVKPEPKKP